MLLTRAVLLIGCIIVCFAGNVHAGNFSSEADSIVKSTYAELRNLELDPERSANVQNILLQRDAGEITFVSGVLTFCRPVQGRVCAAVFTGKGVFRLKPPTTIEQDNCERILGTRQIDVTFSSCLLLFTDTTYTSLSSRLAWRSASINDQELYTIRRSIPFYVSEKSSGIHESISASLFERSISDGFWAGVYDTPYRELYFSINPLEAEEIYLGKRDYSSNRGTEATQVICRFHKKADYAKGADVAERADVVDISHYDIDLSINESLVSEGTAVVTVTPRYNDRHWIPLRLSNYLSVSSVTVGNEEAQSTRSAGQVWIYCKTPLKKGVATTITMRYTGEMFVRQEDLVYMEAGSSRWYPSTDELTRATFDLKFHVADNYSFHCAGKLVSSGSEGHTRNYHFVIDKPEIHASFAIGVFEELVIDDKRTPPVKVLFERHSNQQKNVAQDIHLSIGYYQELFGKAPFEQMTASQINAYHGQAFPGFLHLSVSTFYDGDASGWNEQFVAHEVAHQWWGGAIGWSNYHDQWMGEAFSEYSSMMYMQAVLKNNNEFFNMLKRYRKEILETRKSILGDGKEVGPIWLGYRLSSAGSTSGDYTMQIYHKGAWVMHMLRNMMMDYSNFSDERYLNMMRDFYSTYKGHDPTTEDFQNMVSKHMGQDMSWFFEQWIYGTKVPKYTVAYTTQDAGGGKFKVHMKIKQENVPPTFKMIVPIRINFGEEIGKAPLQINITGADSEFDLPLLPYKPESIDFNIYDSVLCEWEIDD